MIRRIGYLTIFFLLIGMTTISFYLFEINRQGIVYGQEKVVYELPYPGVLPDHPLYLMKVVRDRLMDFFTRDHIKKANLYLLFSDKRANMAIYLIKKGKPQLAAETFVKGEKYFFKIPNLLITSKKQGVPPSSELIDVLKLSNRKHREIINQLLKSSSSGQIRLIEEALEINQDIKKQIDRL